MNKSMLLLLVWAMLHSCFMNSGSGDHGTDLPNSLSIQVVDQDNQPVQNTSVAAWVRQSTTDTVYSCLTDAQGICKISVHQTDSILLFSASLRLMSQTGLDSLRLGFLPHPVQNSKNQVQIHLNQTLGTGSIIGSDSTQKRAFAHFLEIYPTSLTDLNSRDWNADSITQWMQNANSRQADGLVYPLFYSASTVDSAGLPHLTESALTRLKWILQQAKSKDLSIRLVLFSDLDHKLTQTSWADSVTQDGNASRAVYHSIVEPISSLNCDSLSSCLNNYQIEISDNANLLETKSPSSTGRWLSWWGVSAIWMSTGVGFQELNPMLLDSLVSGIDRARLTFVSVHQSARLSPLVFPAELLSGGQATLVRWTGSNPSQQELAKLKSLNYAGWIEPLK